MYCASVQFLMSFVCEYVCVCVMNKSCVWLKCPKAVLSLMTNQHPRGKGWHCDKMLASFPGLPRFFFLRSNNVLDLPLSNPMIARTPEPRGSQDQQHLTSPVRNSLYRFFLFFLYTSVQMGNAPPTSTWSHSRDRCSQVFPVFCRSSASEYYAERKPKNKEQENGGSLGKRLKIVKSPKWKDNIWTAPHISAPFFLGQCY